MVKVYTPVTNKDVWYAINNKMTFRYDLANINGERSSFHEGFYVVFKDKFPLGVHYFPSDQWVWDVQFAETFKRNGSLNKQSIFVSNAEVFDVYRRGLPALAALKMLGRI